LDKLIESYRKELGLEGKEWLCRNCRYGFLRSEDICTYVSPNVIRPRVCIYVQHRIQRALAELLGPLEDEED